MKKKTLLTLIAITMLSLAACGKTEEASGSNVNEPVVESSIESPATIPQESQEIFENTETVVEDSPTVEETNASFEVSEVIYPNGAAPDNINYDDFLNYGAYQNPELIVPYFTITNTSDSAYAIEFEYLNEIIRDDCFEAGESMVVPACLFMDNNDVAKWCNILESEELQYSDGIETSDANTTQNRVQEMITITYDESKVLYENVMGIDIELPANAVANGGDLQYLPCYVIYYDADGNVISCGSSGETFIDWNVISYADKTFTYPALYYTTTNEPFVWATADVYYSYTINQ